ncbi:uncharacterized protein LOC141612968 [Silene latifolia]|uniref:uncharacterized protein LOC141612968 n=1 Tax=Silene latifolia TaxID=37657 RepID=UPI003D76D019
MERNRQMKSTWLAKQFLEVFKARPHWPAADIIETVRRAYKVLIKKNFAYMVKYFAHRMLHGSMKEHYSKIGSYIQALTDEEPNSVFTLTTIPGKVSVFQRLFVCFDALKKGWVEGCRRVLCVDSCFLKTFLGGQLIAATGRDANEQMYPVAWAVVEGENNDSYEWFFKELKKVLAEQDGDGWTIISDQHQSILTMVAQELPKAEHRHCARHIFANWHKSYKGDEMKMLFWNCAKSYNQADFDQALSDMREVDHKAAEAFLACNPSVFCRAFINTTTKTDVIVNNMAETFNAYIIDARAKHVIYMLEDIEMTMMQRLALKKDKAAAYDVFPSSTTRFQVKQGIDEVSVDLVGRTCTCRKWDLTGIPCSHAVSAIFNAHGQPEEYVDDMYKKDSYLRAYGGSIAPCPGQRHWPKVALTLNPPPIKVGPGRPRKKRIRDPHEDPKRSGKLTKHGLQMTCSVCKSKTHNKRTCPDKDKAIEPPAKRGRGRPRVNNVVTEGDASTSTPHHTATAHPTRTGRGGKTVRTGRGSSRGGSRGGGRGTSRGRGGRGRAPQGLGVLFDDNGNAYTNVPGNTRGPVSISGDQGPSTQPTQASINHP